MKLLYLKISGYRGVEKREVEFEPGGITLIRGPNEAGKTSLGEAIGILFKFPDSSKSSEIREIKPVDRDAGPEIELKAESGEYAFTYYKRFLKNPETSLTITRPGPENLTGREAHDRAAEILGETVDMRLWEALMTRQGDALGLPSVEGAPSLTGALDRAAGGGTVEPGHDDLFRKVAAEFEKYYTPGKHEEREVLRKARDAEGKAAAENGELEERLERMQADIERVAALEGEVARAREKVAQLEGEARKHEAELREIEALEKILSEARLVLERECVSRDVLVRAGVERAQLRREIEAENAKKDTLHKAVSELEGRAGEAREKFQKARAEAAEADRRYEAKRALAALGRADFEFLRNRGDLEVLSERRERVGRARREAAGARATLAACRVDAAALKAIRAAASDLAQARARMEAGVPALRLRALGRVRLSVDGVESGLEKGEEKTFPVPERTVVSVPGKLEVEVRAGTSASALSREMDEAAARLGESCAAAGVRDPDGAGAAFEARAAAERKIGELARVEAENLKGLDFGELDRRVVELERVVTDYPGTRPEGTPMPPDMERAGAARKAAESRLAEAEDARERARGLLGRVGGALEEADREHLLRKQELESAGLSLGEKEGKLRRQREETPDADLAGKTEAAMRRVAAAEESARKVEAQLRERNPEKARSLAETAAASREREKRSAREAESELDNVRGRLEILGGEGLHEKLGEARARLERIRAGNRGLFRAAAAAKLLFETVRAEREKVKSRYVGPLKEKIEELGALVFNPSFRVEIDSEKLTVVSRTLDGATVPFGSLSGGTKEQVSLVYRLACAMLTAGEGGAPLLIDDEMGYTDPGRLKAVGAVLARAAGSCQVVIMTCQPDRFAMIGDAKVVNLEAGQACGTS